MADTIEFTIDDASWTDVSTGGLAGFMTNKGSKRAYYREDNADPTPSVEVGHELMSKAEVNFSLDTGQKVWVRSVSGAGKIVVTPGVVLGSHVHTESEITDLKSYLLDTTDTFTGDLGVTGTIAVTEELTGKTVNATGDTAAGALAAMGYTATEGLILTGQGSTYDTVIKNDADVDIARVATGTAYLDIVAGLHIGGAGAANLLDDVEEGTFTATIQDASFSDGESQGYTSQVGNYLKIGNMVFITGEITTSSLGTLSGAIFLANLPFVSSTSKASGSLQCGRGETFAMTAGTSLSIGIIQNTTRGTIYNWDNSLGTTGFSVTEWSADGGLEFQGMYFVD